MAGRSNSPVRRSARLVGSRPAETAPITKAPTKRKAAPTATATSDSKKSAAGKKKKVDKEQENGVDTTNVDHEAPEGNVAPSATEKKPKESAVKLEVDKKVPEAALKLVVRDENDKEHTLGSLTEKKNAIFFMYPKANTPGCTKQAMGFRDNYKDIKAAGYEVYGLSADKPTAQMNWKKKLELPFSLLSDPELKLVSAFGAFKQPKNVIRSHVVFKNGTLQDAQIQVSPLDSVTRATKLVTGKE
ncbi:thioredoxin-like protein [Phlyctochytrium arcticum]|nr:thioredoxin-like protein [Phlyctochytrium arcticum]